MADPQNITDVKQDPEPLSPRSREYLANGVSGGLISRSRRPGIGRRR